MKFITFKSDFILIFIAVIWGLAFVAQRIGMDHIGPFTFNGLRFALGSLSLLPIIIFNTKQNIGQKQGRSYKISDHFRYFSILRHLIPTGGTSLHYSR